MSNPCPHCGRPMPVADSRPVAITIADPLLARGERVADCQQERPAPRLVAPSQPAKPQKIVPILTNHAWLRFLERAKGVDIEGARREIMTMGVQEAIRAGATAVIIDGYKMPVVNGKIVTVLDKGMRPKKKMRPPRGAARPEREELADLMREFAEEVMG